MNLDINISRPTTKLIALLSTLVLCAVLGFLATTNAVAGLLTDERTRLNKEILARGVKYAPNSAGLRARLAEAEMLSEERDLASAEKDARLAVKISPWDYNYWMILASIEETRGDRAAAEESLAEALRLAPNYPVVHWRLANVLLRQGKLGKSLVEFAAANNSSIALLPLSLDLVWRLSSGNLAAVQAITPDQPRAKIMLAQFLIQQSRAAEAAGVFSSIDANARLGQPDSAAVIDALIAGGRAELARFLWTDTVSRGSVKRESVESIWNGDFESDINDKFSQFDWTIGQSPFARASVTRETAHQGARSLRIDFTGRDTTRLDDEVSQRVLVKGGSRYKLSFFVRTEGFTSPEGPRVAVADGKSSPAIGASEAVPSGSDDWRQVSFDFVAPAKASSLLVVIRRIPKFSYDNPTKGTVWFDDFSMTEEGKAK